jgi:hypothetical protein
MRRGLIPARILDPHAHRGASLTTPAQPTDSLGSVLAGRACLFDRTAMLGRLFVPQPGVRFLALVPPRDSACDHGSVHMRGLLLGVLGALCFNVTLLQQTQAQPVYTREPPARSVKAGSVVLVDDGSCPKGKIKEVTGGSNIGGSGVGSARTRRCIPRK